MLINNLMIFSRLKIYLLILSSLLIPFTLHATDSQEIILQKMNLKLKADSLEKQKIQRPVNVLIVGDTSVIKTPSIENLTQIILQQSPLVLETYYINSSKEFFRVFNNIGNIPIQNLYIMGLHGYHSVTTPSFEIHDYRDAENLIDEDLQLSKIKDHLSGKINWMPDSKIILSSCNLIPEPEDEYLVLNAFEKIAEAFGMSSGTVYANYTEGNLYFEDLYGTSIFENENKGKRLERLLYKSAWFVTIPTLLYFEKIIDNQGYVYQFDHTDPNNQHSFVLKADYLNVRRGKMPKEIFISQ